SMSAALVKLGVDLTEFNTGFTTAGTETITVLKTILNETTASSAQITEAFSGAMDSVTSVQGLELLKTQLSQMFDEGRISAEQYKITLNEIEQNVVSTNTVLNDSYAELGVTTQAQYNNTAETARLAYEQIRDSGTASAYTLKEAFAAYSEKALVSNSEIEASFMKVEEAALGLNTQVSESYEALGIQSDESLNLTANAAKDAYEIIKNSGTASSETLARAFEALQEKSEMATDETVLGFIEAESQINKVVVATDALGDSTVATTTQVVEGVDESTKAAAGSVNAWFAAGMNQLQSYSQAAADEFVANISRVYMGIPPPSFNDYFLTVERARAYTMSLVDSQKSAVDSMSSNMANLNSNSIEQLDYLDQTVDGFQYLDQQSLSKIKGEIESARRATESLNDSISSTLSSLQDELDRLDDNQANIENRKYQEDKIRLEQAYQDAVDIGNQEVINQARASININNEIHNRKMDDIVAEQKAKEAPVNRSEHVTVDYVNSNTPLPPPPQVTGKDTITLKFIAPNGSTSSTEVDTQAIAMQIIDILEASGAVVQ
ncbi:MAG: hypothetical protein KAI17_16840, partial [Thiotrichaceae bacterium]|nr:hypothetical protein [Thiotrichaceae bacterium]